jgi:uracil-DNA glycosylase
MPPITNDWASELAPEYKKDYYKKLFDFVGKEYASHTVYPPGDDIFNAFHLTPLKDVKCVIIGQDPYHEPGQAHGLCFSVKPGVDTPPSLLNIYKELHDDLGCYIPDNGYLVKWAKQGVLMLNAVLTVRAHQAASHQNQGWEQFTDAVIDIVNRQDRPIVFLLWGGFARKKKYMLNNPKHLILEAPHPSPLSVYRGFYGCKHFSKTNEFLVANGLEPIDWQIENLAKKE